MFRLIRRIKSLFSVQFAWIADHLTCYAVATPSAWSVLIVFKMDVEYVGLLLESAHGCICNSVLSLYQTPSMFAVHNLCFCFYQYLIVLSVWKSKCMQFSESRTKTMWYKSLHYPMMDSPFCVEFYSFFNTAEFSQFNMCVSFNKVSHSNRTYIFTLLCS